MTQSIIFCGARAQRPGRGGQMWVFLQYLLGFRRLGYDVLYLDALEPEYCVDERGKPCDVAKSWNLRYFCQVMRQFGLENRWALLCNGSRQILGMTRQDVLDRVKRAGWFINVMGFLRDEEILAAAPRRVFLDIDPGFGQMWRELQLADIFAGHDDFVTVGANVGRSDCTVPTCGIQWITTFPPVVLEQWPRHSGATSGRFTSVVTWRGPFGPIDYRGTTYGLRVHEFRKFMELPGCCGKEFELALDIDAADKRDTARLHENGWRLVDPANVATTPQEYQHYVQQSLAEFGVAKNMYVATRSGWLSDRTVCYLASGKPALIQDTGLREGFPMVDGLLFFSSLEEANDGVERIAHNYARHSDAARRLAEEVFDSDKVLSRLLQQLGPAEATKVNRWQ